MGLLCLTPPFRRYHDTMSAPLHSPLYAIILAGGLSRRLGGTPKAGLVFDGATLLARTVSAVRELLPGAEATTAEAALPAEPRIAVVGPANELQKWLGPLTEQVRLVQEDPPFSGPAAGIAAALDALPGADGRVLVLACDMPAAGELARRLLREKEAVIAYDGGRRQPLAALYSLGELRAAAAAARAGKRLQNASVNSLVARLAVKECVVPAGLAADIDTWEDARAHGITAPGSATEG